MWKKTQQIISNNQYIFYFQWTICSSVYIVWNQNIWKSQNGNSSKKKWNEKKTNETEPIMSFNFYIYVLQTLLPVDWWRAVDQKEKKIAELIVQCVCVCVCGWPKKTKRRRKRKKIDIINLIIFFLHFFFIWFPLDWSCYFFLASFFFSILFIHTTYIYYPHNGWLVSLGNQKKIDIWLSVSVCVFSSCIQQP